MNKLHENVNINDWMLLGYTEQEATELNRVANEFIDTCGEQVDSNLLFNCFKSFTTDYTLEEAISVIYKLNSVDISDNIPIEELTKAMFKVTENEIK